MSENTQIHDLLLWPAQLMLDRGSSRSAQAAELCAQLEGRVMQVNPGSLAPNVYFKVADGRFTLSAGPADSPDVEISGSPLNLLRLAGEDPQAAIRGGYVKVTGNAELAEDFQTLLELVRPDWETELARLTGQSFAHEAGRFARGFTGWARRAKLSLGLRLAEHLTEDSRDLVATTDINEFCTGVDQVSAGVERAEAKIKNLRTRTQTHSAD